MRSRRRVRIALVGGVAAAIILLPGVQSASGRTAQAPVLSATVGPGFTITMTTASGQPVTTLVEGTYTINVSDKSTFHNFHLFGPDFNQTTTVAEVADRTWTVTLKRGVCLHLRSARSGWDARNLFGRTADEGRSAVDDEAGRRYDDE
jgi:hypothetical protein